MKIRERRIASALHRAVQSVLAEGLRDPRLDDTMVTVTQVSVDEPLTTAVVRVVVRPEEKASLALHALDSAAPYIRKLCFKRVDMRRIPRLLFREDESARRQAETLRALARAKEELPDTQDTETPPAGADEAPGGEKGGEH